MILKAIEISKSYRGRKVVDNISVEVNQGEIVGLLGPNGAGKTTSFYMIVGLIKPEYGNISLDKEIITSYPMYQRAQKGIGYLAQEESVFRKLSVEDNILGVLEFSSLTKNEQKDKEKRDKMESNASNLHSGASEVFLMANNQNDADTIYAMNDMEANSIIKARQDKVKQKGSVDMTELPDIQRDINEQMMSSRRN